MTGERRLGKIVYLALMPRDRKAKAVPPSALDFYKREARLVWAYEGTADAARARLWPWDGGADGATAAQRIAERAAKHGTDAAGLAGRLPRIIGGTEAARCAALPGTVPSAPAEPRTQAPSHLWVSMAPHAELHQVYLGGKRFGPPPGSVPGEYGPVDPATGARYKCLGEDTGDRRGISHSADHKPGAFYPPMPFLSGDDTEGEPLGFEALEAIAADVLGGTTRGYVRVLLPRGMEGGRLTWQPALKPAVFEEGRYCWGGLTGEPSPVARIKKAWPGAEVSAWRTTSERGRVEAFLPAPEGAGDDPAEGKGADQAFNLEGA
jgi:hypothetical protein